MICTIKIKYKKIFGYVIIFFLLLFIIYSFLFEKKHLQGSQKLLKIDCQNDPIDVVYTWVNGSDPKFLNDFSNFQSKYKFVKKISYSPSRYYDRHELKFSLRSLELFAPWIRNIYIVTNGQIPNWLNLDHEKIHLITHEDIFLNKDDLPTFSSPAIESNIHRIPGLSKKFLYFNDDIYLGAPVFLEDFYTKDRGFLLYMDYPIGNCDENCHWLFVNNGVCNIECNVFNCQYDGGDCDSTNVSTNLNATQTKEANRTNQAYHSNITVTNLSILSTSLRNNTKTYGNATSTNSSQPTISNNIKDMVLKANSSQIKDLIHRHNDLMLEAQKRLKRRRTPSKRNFDAYHESLQHTNRNLNLKYGYFPRYVPSHMPFLIDVDIMNELQEKFSREYSVTSGNKVRNKDDIQFSFMYYYFIIHESFDVTIEEIFDIFDTDRSRTLSDREIRTILTKIYELPLTIENINEFDSIITNCSRNIKYDLPRHVPLFERYIDSNLPVITAELISKCDWIREKLLWKFGKKPKHKYEILKDVKEYVTFQMINANIKHSVEAFDRIRRNPTKFICLNDNIQGSRNSSINPIWYDFYISRFPTKSQYELPDHFRNHFGHVSELRSYQVKITILMYAVVIFILYFIFFVLCKKKCLHVVKNKLFCR